MVNRRLHGKQAQPEGYQQGPRAGVKVTAAQLQGWYGPRLSQPPLSEAKSPYLLHRAILSQIPGLVVTHQCVKTWWQKYKEVQPEHCIHTVEDLEAKHGERI